MITSPPSTPVKTATLADYSNQALMVPQLREPDSAGVIQELSQLLHRESYIPDLLPFYNAAMNREYLISTAMEYGMAFPHARVIGLERLSFALGKCGDHIAWGPKGAVPVDIVFLMAVPATDATGYLQLLSAVSRLSKNSELIYQLRSAQTPDAMFSVLNQVPVAGSRPVAR